MGWCLATLNLVGIKGFGNYTNGEFTGVEKKKNRWFLRDYFGDYKS
jgi:hypothetical protein